MKGDGGFNGRPGIPGEKGLDGFPGRDGEPGQKGNGKIYFVSPPLLRQLTQWAHDVNITPPQRRCNVMTLHRR